MTPEAPVGAGAEEAAWRVTQDETLVIPDLQDPHPCTGPALRV